MNKICMALIAGLALLTALSDGVRANDSNAHQTSGGLILSKTDAVAMRSEELRISMERITIRYEFQNLTDKDVTLTVAFPLPDVDPDYFNAPFDRDIRGEQFETTVDGVPIALQAERTALLNDLDVTEKLVALGLSPDQQVSIDKLEKMSRSDARNVVEKLVELGLMKANGLMSPGTTEAAQRDWEPQWSYRRKFYREQVFPVGKTVVVTHSYKPSLRRSINVPKAILEDENMRNHYCINAKLVRTLKALAKKSEQIQSGLNTNINEINYILTSGINWAERRIGDFHLVIDKGKPGNLVSLCESDIRKTGPTTYEMRKKNFRPTVELNILIIDVPAN